MRQLDTSYTVCNILVPRDTSMFLFQDLYGNTYNESLPFSKRIIYRDVETHNIEYAKSSCCYTCVVNGIGHMCSILYISSALEPPAKLYVTTEVPIPTPTANPTSASSTVTIGSSNTNPKTGVSCAEILVFVLLK